MLIIVYYYQYTLHVSNRNNEGNTLLRVVTTTTITIYLGYTRYNRYI